MAEEKVLLRVEIEEKEAQKRIVDLTTRMQLLRDKAVSTTKTFGANSEQMARVKARIKETNAEMRKQEKVLVDTNKVAKLARGSYDQLSAAYSVNKARLNAMSQEQRFSTKAGRDLEKQTKKIYEDMNRLQQRSGKFTLGVGNYFKGLLSSMTAAAAALLGFNAVIGLFKNIGRVITEFSTQQSKLASVLGVTKNEISDLADEAKRLGAETRYTAAEVSGLQVELAKLGFTSQEIKDSTGAILALATATGTDLPSAAKVTGSALRAFGLDAIEAERVTSTLAVATARSALSFSDYETALSTVAPVAKAFGFSVEDTTALLGSLKDAGFDASTAATSTRNIILNLADSNGKLAKELGRPVKNLGDLTGAFKDLKERGIDLATALDLTDKRSVAAFSTFLDGSDKIMSLKNSITGATDEMYKMVAVMEDNLQGDTAKLSSAWEGFILSIEDGNGIFSKAIRGIVQALTTALGAVQEFGSKATRWFDKMMQSSGAFRAIIELLGSSIGFTFREIIRILTTLKDTFVLAFKVIDSALKLDFKGIVKATKEFAKSQTKIAKDRAADFIKTKNDIVKAYSEEGKAEYLLRKKTEKETQALKEKLKAEQQVADASEKTTKATEKEIKENEKKEKELADARKNALNLLKKGTAEEIKILQEKYAQARKINKENTELSAEEVLTINTQLKNQEEEEITEIKRKGILYRAALETKAIDENLKKELLQINDNERAKFEAQIKATQDRLTKLRALAETATDEELDVLNTQILENERNLVTDKAAIQKLNLDLELNQALDNEDKKFQIKLDYLNKEIEANKNNKDKLAELEAQKTALVKDNNKKKIDSVISYFEKVGEVASSLNDALKAFDDRDLERIQEKQTKETEALDSKYEKGTISKRDYERQKTKLEQEADNEKARIERRAAIREKLLRSFQASIATAVGITNALTAVPFSLFNTIAAGVVGAAQLVAINAAPLPKASRGGVFKGKSHAQGGIPIEVEGDEAIINKKSTRMYAPLLSAINQAGGGVAFANGGMPDGGYATRQAISTQPLGGIISAEVNSAIAGLKIYTTMEDVRRADKKYTQIQEGGRV